MQITYRRNKILEIIQSRQIETQEELAASLDAEGIKATQATISRDIKDLGLIKVPSSAGRQYYVRDSGGRQVTSKVADIAYSSIISASVSGQIVVIKTTEGFGRVTKLAALGLCETMGCVADDDTVFVAFDDQQAANAFYKKLNSMILY